MNKYEDFKLGDWWGIHTRSNNVFLYNITELDGKFIGWKLYIFRKGYKIETRGELMTKVNFNSSDQMITTEARILDSELSRNTFRILLG